jgi:hypothetical protein
VWGYPASYIGCALIQVLALPCMLMARRQRASSDRFDPA